MPVVSLPPNAVVATHVTRKGVRVLVFEPPTPIPYTTADEVSVFIHGGRISVNGVVVGTVGEAHTLEPTFDPLGWTWTVPKPRKTS